MQRCHLALFTLLGACAAPPDPDPDATGSPDLTADDLDWAADERGTDTGSADDGGQPEAEDTGSTHDADGLATSPMGRRDQGSMQMRMHDAPIDLDEMPVTIGRVQVREADGGLLSRWTTISSDPVSFDLLSLQGGREVTLFDGDLDADDYDAVRLVLDEVAVVVDGVEIALRVPLSAGVVIASDFTIEADHSYEMVLDFDALASVTETPLGYRLSPDITVESFTEVDDGQ